MRRLKSRSNRKLGLHSNVLLDPQLQSSFAGSVRIGFCLCDDDLRICAVNDALALMNGVPGDQQPGKTLRQVLGRPFASRVEPCVQTVCATQNGMLQDLSGKIPTRSEVGHWIVSYFPLKCGRSRATQVGAAIVEITEQKKLETSIHSLSEKLLDSAPKERELLLDELQHSITGYHSMLKTNLERMVRTIWDGHKRTDLLAQSVKLLDHFPVISLRHQSTVKRMFEQIEEDSVLRSDFFRDVAARSDLQQEVLKLLARHPAVQGKILSEMATTLQFRRKLLKLAGKPSA